jgi:nonribosomal peptide synthetase DhbF
VRNLIHREILSHDIESMAADYLKVIQEIQATGPYNLLGWSFGGLVAHAMATQLQSQNEEVSLLALLDSYPMDRATLVNSHDKEQEVLSATTDDTLLKMLEGLWREGHVASPLTRQDYESVKNACENNMRIISTFSPRQFEGAILLFVAAKSHSQPPIDSWKPYVNGRILVHEIDCTHDSLMNELPAGRIGKVLATELVKQRMTTQSLVQWRTK